MSYRSKLIIYAYLRSAAWSCFAASFLVGCGGSADGVVGETMPDGGLVFSGVVAGATAISNASVEAKCSGNVVAKGQSSDIGEYTVVMPPSAKLPCILRVTGPSGFLYAAVDESFSRGKVNINQLSQLVLSRSGGTSAGFQYDSLSAGVVPGVNPMRLRAAHKDVVDTVRPLAGC